MSRRLSGRAALPFVATVAAGGGLLTGAAGVPGGLIFGSVVGAGAASLCVGGRVVVPVWVRNAAFIGIGCQVGMRVTRQSLGPLRDALLPAVLAALALIAAGALIGCLLRLSGRGPDGEVLATSPGALEVLIGLAAEHDYPAVQIALFHLVRLIIVVVSIPLTLHLVRG